MVKGILFVVVEDSSWLINFDKKVFSGSNTICTELKASQFYQIVFFVRRRKERGEGGSFAADRHRSASTVGLSAGDRRSSIFYHGRAAGCGRTR
nr:hypothetical protein Iba_chr10eCG7370 [Ipomoea batatas]